MNLASQAPARMLFRAALVIFVVTIVIGILNGMDIWSPAHNVLLTHVHAGTLGWITLSVVGAAFLIFGEGANEKALAAYRRLATWIAVFVGLYVIAFFIGTGIYRPIAGTLVLIVIIMALTWVVGRFRAAAKSIPQLALLLAMISLTIGAILGVLLGLFVANGSLPGLSTETAGNLAGAHPVAMLIGYLILAGVAISDWALNGPDGVLGRIVAWALFVAGLLVNISFIFNIEPLIQVASLMQVIAIILHIVRMWPRIKGSEWAAGDNSNFARFSIVFLVVGIGLLVYVVQLFTSGQLDPETGEGPIGVLLAFDHAMFIGVMTNALFAAIGTIAGATAGSRVVRWGVNLGLTGFLAGLVTDTALLKRISTPIMGLALLYGIYVFFFALGRTRAEATPISS